MQLNVPQVNDIIYCAAYASDNSSQGALFFAVFEAKGLVHFALNQVVIYLTFIYFN